jgi:hypothetical protein
MRSSTRLATLDGLSEGPITLDIARSATLRAAQVQRLAFGFGVELVPCRRRQDGPTLIVTSELTEGRDKHP